MAKRTLAAHWKQLSEAEKQEFVGLFRAFLLDSYADKIEGYVGEQVSYLSKRLDGPYAEVRTKLVSSKTEIPLDYRLLNKSGAWLVYDIVVDSVGLGKNYRSQFERTIRSSSYADLVEKLPKKSKETQTLKLSP